MDESHNPEGALPDGHSEQHRQWHSKEEEKGQIASRASKQLQWWIRREARHWGVTNVGEKGLLGEMEHKTMSLMTHY